MNATRRGFDADRTRLALRALMLVVSVTVTLHVAVLLPIAGARPGDHPLLDTGTDFVGALCVGAMLWPRSRLEVRERGACGAA